MSIKQSKSYNHKRPHNGVNKISPEIFEKQWHQIEDHLKPIITICNNEIDT